MPTAGASIKSSKGSFCRSFRGGTDSAWPTAGDAAVFSTDDPPVWRQFRLESIDRSRVKRIGIAESQPMHVCGLESLFTEDASVEILSTTAVAALRDKELSLVILDDCATMHLFEMLAAFRRSRPRLKVMVLGPARDHGYIQRVIGAGAKGYLAVTATLDEVRMAIEVVLDGSIWAPRKVMARLLEGDQAAEAAAAAPVQLTARERDVMQMLVAGNSNREIAASLGIDEATVKAHVGRLLRKYRVQNRTALSVRALEKKFG